MSATPAHITATKVQIVTSAATGDWEDAAEELCALPADELDRFYGQLCALTAMARVELRKGNHR